MRITALVAITGLLLSSLAPARVGAQTSSTTAPPSASQSNGQVQESQPIPAQSAQQPSSNTTDPLLQQRIAPLKRVPMALTAPVGSELRATLDQPLSTKTTQDGQQFTATLTDPVRNSNNDVIIPAGAKVHGTVSAETGKYLPAIRGKGQLALRFTDIQLVSGASVPVQATLIALTEANSQRNLNDEGQITGGTSGKDAAKDLGIGAAVGTIGGLIFGSALKGMLIGALAGGGYIAATGGKDVEVPANTGIRIRLDQNLTVPTDGSSPQPITQPSPTQQAPSTQTSTGGGSVPVTPATPQASPQPIDSPGAGSTATGTSPAYPSASTSPSTVSAPVSTSPTSTASAPKVGKGPEPIGDPPSTPVIPQTTKQPNGPGSSGGQGSAIPR